MSDMIVQDYHARVRDDVFPLVERAGGTLLDFGGGTGATGARLKELGHADRVGCVDLVAGDDPAIPLDFHRRGNLEDAALIREVIAAEGPFQCVLCLDILEHLLDPWSVVAELHRGLAPGGTIVASIPNIRNFTATVPLILGNRWTYTEAGILDRTHLRFFVKSTAVELMTHTGLALEIVRGEPTGGRKVKYFRAATLGLLNSFTDRQYFIRVRNEAA